MFFVHRGLMEKICGFFLISISFPATDFKCLIKKFDIDFVEIQINSFQEMFDSFGVSHDQESPGSE